MDILDSKKVISDSLKSLLGIEKYCKIIGTIQKEDFKADKLERMVSRLNSEGVENTPYIDIEW